MSKGTSMPNGYVVPIARIVGAEPRQRCAEAQIKLTTAVRLHRRPCFSFANVDAVGEEFVHLTLGRVLLFAAQHGHPAGAVDLDPAVCQQLHHSLRDIGVLMPRYDRDVVLGASEQLTITLQALRQGCANAAQLAAALGCSELAAESQLAVVDHWGLRRPAELAAAGHLSIAA